MMRKKSMYGKLFTRALLVLLGSNIHIRRRQTTPSAQHVRAACSISEFWHRARHICAMSHLYVCDAEKKTFTTRERASNPCYKHA